MNIKLKEPICVDNEEYKQVDLETYMNGNPALLLTNNKPYDEVYVTVNLETYTSKNNIIVDNNNLGNEADVIIKGLFDNNILKEFVGFRAQGFVNDYSEFQLTDKITELLSETE